MAPPNHVLKDYFPTAGSINILWMLGSILKIYSSTYIRIEFPIIWKGNIDSKDFPFPLKTDFPPAGGKWKCISLWNSRGKSFPLNPAMGASCYPIFWLYPDKTIGELELAANYILKNNWLMAILVIFGMVWFGLFLYGMVCGYCYMYYHEKFRDSIIKNE